MTVGMDVCLSDDLAALADFNPETMQAAFKVVPGCVLLEMWHTGDKDHWIQVVITEESIRKMADAMATYVRRN